MAATLKLVRRADTASTGSDISSVSLLDNTDGFDLDYMNGWTPAVANGLKPRNVMETITLISKGDDTDDLASNRQALDAKLKQAEWYWDDPTERYSVWLRAQLKDETYARQTLIRRGNAQWGGDSIFGPFVEDCDTDRSCTLGLERLPWWEDTDYQNIGGVDDITYGGDAADLAYSIGGDVPARIAAMRLHPSTTFHGLDEFWLGFRTSRFGVRTNFEPVWQCDDGSIYANTGTTEQTDYMECDFSDGSPDGEAMQSRFYVKTDDVTSNESDQRGQFLVLLRAQVTDGTTTCRVRLLDGYVSDASKLRRQDRVKIDSDSWFLYALGTVQIPSLDGLVPAFPDDVITSYRLCLQAERTAGTGSLRCDRFILIPIGEGAVYVSNISMTTHNNRGTIRFSPKGYASGWSYSDITYNSLIGVMSVRPQGPYGFTLPTGTVRIVFAAQEADEHDNSREADLTFYRVYPRWRTLRGSDDTSFI